MKIRKIASASSPGRFFRDRMTIRQFKHREDGFSFLNKQSDNSWQEYTGELKAGTYARAGGEWRNVKTLDPSVLAHV